MHSATISGNAQMTFSTIIYNGLLRLPTWGKVFKNGPSKICGRQSLKNLKRYGLLKKTISL